MDRYIAIYILPLHNAAAVHSFISLLTNVNGKNSLHRRFHSMVKIIKIPSKD